MQLKILPCLIVTCFLPYPSLSKPLTDDCQFTSSGYIELEIQLKTEDLFIRKAEEPQLKIKIEESYKNCPAEIKKANEIFENLVSTNNLYDEVEGDRSLRIYIECENFELSAHSSRGSMSLSLGLFQIDNTDELASVLSHELSHHLLLHDVYPKESKRIRELKADALGQKLFLNAGYKPSAAVSSLDKLALELKRLGIPDDGKWYPTFFERISVVNDVSKKCSRGSNEK